MSLRSFVAVLLIGIAALAFYAWTRNTQRATAPVPQASGPSGAPSAGIQGMPPPGGQGMPPSGGGQPQVSVQTGGDPGVDWTVPKRWTNGQGSSMRLATYAIPGTGGAEGAQCAVFYFGPGQGGGTSANIDRWIDEFADPKTPERTSKTVNGMPVSFVRVKGTYVAHAGMGGDTGSHPDHELYGAIVEAPSGAVFFKLTGPAKTVDAAAADFDHMLGSLKKKG
jgi:hypothetical protein